MRPPVNGGLRNIYVVPAAGGAGASHQISFLANGNVKLAADGARMASTCSMKPASAPKSRR